MADAPDQGSETVCPDQLAPLFRDGMFVAHPGSPWQGGTEENTNGLLRQYLPKGSAPPVHTAEGLRAIEDLFDKRPRRTLGGRAHAKLFAGAPAG
jgi:IS30 family transposase